MSDTGAFGNAAAGTFGTVLSGNGRTVVFHTDATNLVPGAPDGLTHTYARDLWKRKTYRVSESAAGPANKSSGSQAVSQDGTRFLFASSATNLVANDTNGHTDLFLVDGTTSQVQMASVNSAGQPASLGFWSGSALSGDGRIVVFGSTSNNLDPRNTNTWNSVDLYRHDSLTGETTLMTASVERVDGGNGQSSQPSLSHDGSVSAFTSLASDLVAGDTNGKSDIFMFNSGAISRLSSPTGSQANGGSSAPHVSGDGTRVVFVSEASNLAPEDTNGIPDTFVLDRTTNSYARYPLPTSGAILSDISADARYFVYTTRNRLAPDDTDDSLDVYRFDTLTGQFELRSRDTTGANANGTADGGGITDDGQLVAFYSLSPLVPGAGGWQVYTRGDHPTPRHISRSMEDLFGRPRHAFYPGDPVNSATGNFVDATVDLPMPEQASGLSLERAYNSMDTSSGVLGVGWSHPFDVRLIEGAAGAMTYRAADGRRVVFEPDGLGGFAEPLEFPATLATVGAGGWTLTHRDGAVEHFDSGGLPTSVTDAHGQQAAYTWASGRIASVTGSLGHTLTATYDGGGRLDSLTSSDGRVTRYLYTAGGALGQVTMDGVGQLNRYEHDASSRITKARNGADAPVVTNVFDGRGRVVTQTSPQGDTIRFAYDDFYGRTTVTWVASGQTVTFEHDEDGRVTRVIDPLGEVAERSYDADGNLVESSERGGGTVTQTFDTAGNLLTRSEPAGGTHTWTYDAANRVITYTDSTNAVTSYAYTGDSRIPSGVTDPEAGVTTVTESDGLVTSIEDADGLLTAYAYDAAGNVASVTDPAGEATTMTYDAGGRLLTVTTPLGHTSSNSYDDAGRLETSTDAAGMTTTYAYDAAGRLAQVTDPLGEKRSFTYTANGSPLTETDERNKITTYQYDSSERLTKIVRPGSAETTVVPGPLGRVASVTNPVGIATSYTYDAEGNVLTETTPAGTTTYTYDGRGQVLSATDPLNRTTTYGYDLMGRLLSVTDPAAATSSYDYDGVGRLIRSETPLGHETFRRYTPAGRLDEVEDPLGNISAHDYDAAGRLSSLTSPEGGVTAFAYDDDGRQVSRTSAAGLVTATSYDAVGRVLAITGPAGDVTTRTYTPRGELATLTDATGGVRQFSYDLVGRLTKAVAANGGETLYGYDDRGNRTSQTSARGGVDQWTYDLADRVTTWTDPVNRVTSYSYDAAGRLHVVTDPTARTTTHGYDAAGQLLSKTYGDGTSHSFAWDAAGRRTTMSNAGGVTAFAWDADGRLSEITHPDTKTLGFGHDAANRRTSVTYPGGAIASYTYDGDDRLTQVSHPSLTSPIMYTHDADGRVLSELMPGVARTWAYDDGRVESYQDTRGGTARTWDVARDLAGRITAETRSDGTVGRYTYDPAGQLLEASQRNGSSGTNTIYEYDLTGNRVSERTNELIKTRHTYDAANRLSKSVVELVGLAVGAQTSYGNDGAGRRTSQLVTDLNGVLVHGAESWTYDAAGRLAAHEVLDDTLTPTLTDERVHDPDGRLSRVDVMPAGAPTETTTLRWDPTAAVDQILELERSSASPIDLVYGMDRALAVTGGVAEPFLHDIYGSALTTSGTSNVVRAGAYDPFGVPAGTGGTEPAFGYRGELHVSGDVHLRARDYDPTTGRFTSKDPLDGVPGEVLAANPYPYAANDPLNMVDPLGERPFNDGTFSMIPRYWTPDGWTSMPPRGLRQPDGGVLRGIGRAGIEFGSGISHLVTNPSELWRAPNRAYHDAGGGFHGALAGFNQFNPAYHAITAGDACLNAYHAGHGYAMGRDCTNTIIDTVGTILIAEGAARAASRGLGTTAKMGNAAAVEARLGALARGNSPRVRVVESTVALDSLFQDLARNGSRINRPTYSGHFVRLPDGTEVGRRTYSATGGPAIDIRLPSGKNITVHVQ